MRKANAVSSTIAALVCVVALLGLAALIEASDGMRANFGVESSITAHTICKKVTNNSPTGKDAYIPTNFPEEWLSFQTNPPTGITLADCAMEVVPVGQTTATNVNLCTVAGNPTQPGNYVFTVPTGATINSASASLPALTTGTCWAPGSTVTIINSGSIYGKGGDGGGGGGYTAPNTGVSGGDGGSAIFLGFPLTIDTAGGYIFGGGGGGGGGGFGRGTKGCAWTYGGGGGGGGRGSADSLGGNGGSGYSGASTFGFSGNGGSLVASGDGGSGAVGSTPAINGGAGGNGGDWGTPGSAGSIRVIPPGYTNVCSYGNAGAGGAGGKAVQLNGNSVTWQGGNDATHVKGAVQ